MSTEPEGSASPITRWMTVGRFVWHCAQASCVAAALVHPIASLVSRRSWIADMLTHFQEPALAATLLAIGVTFRPFRKLAVVLMLLAAWQVVPLARYMGSNPVQPDPASPERLKIVMTNLLWDNDRHDEVIRLIRTERPDILGLVEFTTSWGEALAEVRDEFPYRCEAPAGPSGLALWFRKEPKSLGPAISLNSGGWPLIEARFEFAGSERRFWLVHPSAPVALERRRAGFPELDAIAVRVCDVGGSRIVIGDLNTTDGSAHFRDFLEVSGLRDTRLGFGRQGSWPTERPYRLAIDHAFVSDDLAVVDRRLGPDVGSDHLPLVIELAPAISRKSATQTTHP